MTTRRLPTGSAPSFRPTPFFTAPRVAGSSDLQAALAMRWPKLTRRTYSAARVRFFIMVGIALLSLTTGALVVRSWSLGRVPEPLILPADRQVNPASRRPASRSFRYANSVDPRRTPDATGRSFSFSAHPTQELGALVGFITALPSNSIPLTVDPAAPIDPELVLGFNTRTDSAAVVHEVDEIVSDTWARNPVVVFSELHSPVAPASRAVKRIIDELSIYPPPTVFEVDDRVDAEVLRPLLMRLTGFPSLPVVLVGGKPVGSLAELRVASQDGTLKRLVQESGAFIEGNNPRKHRKI